MSAAAAIGADDAIERIRAAVGPRGIIDDPADMAPYLREQRGLYRGAARLVVRPADTAEVAAVMRHCAAAGIAVVPQGGNTGLVGGGVPWEHGRSIVLSLGRMNRVRHVDPLNHTITVDAGCILAEVQRVAESHDRLFPLSLGAEGTCTIGGNIATNAGGVAVLRYGTMRDLVLGLEVVLADGAVWDGLRGLRKDNTGYDLKQLFIGAEGTLGIVTAATLKLFPRPRDVRTALLGFKQVDDVMQAFAGARAASGDQLTAFEMIPRIGLDMAIRHVPGVSDPLDRPYPVYALVELSSSDPEARLADTLERFLGAMLECGLVEDGVVAASTAQAQALWRIREAIVEAQRYEGASIKHDVAVPVSAVGDFVRQAEKAVADRLPGTRVVAFGHVGDGNIHFNLSQPAGADGAGFLARWAEFNRIVHDIVAALGGSISAEHGIGRLKRDELLRYKPMLDLQLMRKLKRALDPDNIMNPGKILGD